MEEGLVEDRDEGRQLKRLLKYPEKLIYKEYVVKIMRNSKIQDLFWKEHIIGLDLGNEGKTRMEDIS